MSDSTTFQRVSGRPMPRLSVIPFDMRTKTVHLNYCRIFPMRHMCWIMSTRHIQQSVLRGVFEFSPRYASHSHCLKCPTQRWVYKPDLRGRRRKNHCLRLRLQWGHIIHMD